MSFVDEMRQELAKALQAHVETPISDEAVPRFQPIAPAREVREMVAVDGSYSFLLNLSSWWLALVSVGLLTFRFDGEAYHRQKHRLEQRIIAVSTFEEYVETQDELHKALFEFTEKSAEQHRDMVNEYRRLIEGQLAINFAADEENAIVAIDGALQEFPKRFEFMERLVKVCEDRGHILVGISKDSTLHGFGHVLTDENLLKRCEERNGSGPAFVRAAEAVQTSQKGLLYGDVYYAKFHERAPKWFRVDIGTMRKEPDYVFGHIAPYCRSLISIGYPLPLLEAHRMAVTVRQMRSAYLELLIRTATKMGMDIRQVLDGLTAMEGRPHAAFHEYLDRISRGLR